MESPDVDARTESIDSAALGVSKPKRYIVNIAHAVVLILSLLLIIYISYDTFKDRPFLSNHYYMTFQFWVCIAFLVDFFTELIISRDKKYYLKTHWLFFLISIPYLNIVNQFNLHLGPEPLFYLRFVPLLRGAYSLAMVLGYISHNRAASLITQYGTILIVLVYSMALIFFYEEKHVNPNVKSFWDAIYWALMNTTTVGCYFPPMTPVGKIISVILPVAGMLLLPLFTVFITSRIQQFDKQRQRIEEMFALNDKKKAAQVPEASENSQPAQASAPSQPSEVSGTSDGSQPSQPS